MSKPYAFINPSMEPYHWLKNQLAKGATAEAKFDQLNQHLLNHVIMPGQIVLVGDDSTLSCTREEADLMQSALDVNEVLLFAEPSTQTFMVENYDLLQHLLSYGSIGIGSTTAAWSKHLSGVEQSLNEIDGLYRQLKAGSLSRDQFIAQRQRLFARLDTQLQGIGRYGTGLRTNTRIKPMLGISTKSYLHTGEIAGYAQRIKGISQMARVLKKGAYVGMALDVLSSAAEVREACSTGREEECTKVKYVEAGKVGFGIPSAGAGAVAAVGICAALSIPTAGAAGLACGIVAGAAGGWLGGFAGSKFGASVGENFYEVTRP